MVESRKQADIQHLGSGEGKGGGKLSHCPEDTDKS